MFGRIRHLDEDGHNVGRRPAKYVELGGGLPEREQCSSLEEWTMDEIVIRIRPPVTDGRFTN